MAAGNNDAENWIYMQLRGCNICKYQNSRNLVIKKFSNKNFYLRIRSIIETAIKIVIMFDILKDKFKIHYKINPLLPAINLGYYYFLDRKKKANYLTFSPQLKTYAFCTLRHVSSVF